MNDDTYTAMPAQFPKLEIEDGEKKFKFRIPKFEDNVVIDPSVTPGRVPKNSSTSLASWQNIHIFFLLLLQIFVLFTSN